MRTPDMDHLDFIKLLIAKGANVNARICGAESTPEECKGDSTETRTNFTMQWLFEDGATPFLRAAQSGDVELMKLLLAHGADPKIDHRARCHAAGRGFRHRLGGRRDVTNGRPRKISKLSRCVWIWASIPTLPTMKAAPRCMERRTKAGWK